MTDAWKVCSQCSSKQLIAGPCQSCGGRLRASLEDAAQRLVDALDAHDGSAGAGYVANAARAAFCRVVYQEQGRTLWGSEAEQEAREIVRGIDA